MTYIDQLLLISGRFNQWIFINRSRLHGHFPGFRHSNTRLSELSVCHAKSLTKVTLNTSSRKTSTPVDGTERDPSVGSRLTIMSDH